MKIKIELSKASIDNAIKEIEIYRTNLDKKVAEFIKRLALVGIDTAKNIMQSVPEKEAGEYAFSEPILSSDGKVTGVSYTLSGSNVLFVEFSAGVRYGTQYYPLPSGAQYGAGTYPGKGHWADLKGWWYEDGTGNYVHSYGNRAYMPMYHGIEAIILQADRIASEVFKT